MSLYLSFFPSFDLIQDELHGNSQNEYINSRDLNS